MQPTNTITPSMTVSLYHRINRLFLYSSVLQADGASSSYSFCVMDCFGFFREGGGGGFMAMPNRPSMHENHVERSESSQKRRQVCLKWNSAVL